MQIDKQYNLTLIRRLETLLSDNRDSYLVDLHLHTTYSADGLQTVTETLRNARDMHFDIISITDHDSIAAYQEILDSSLRADTCFPIIIPGVEFTVSFPQYKGRCHVLKYFFDFTNQEFQCNLRQNKLAYNTRVDLWFARIAENRFLQYFFEKYRIECSKEEYYKMLMTDKENIPEYTTIAKYIYCKLQEKGIGIWDVYDKAYDDNVNDPCVERREKKAAALRRFYKKYSEKDISSNYRKLRPIIAAVGVDDTDYPDYPSSGSLSVGEYGQISIHNLKNTGINILAHPDISKLDCVDQVTDILSGLEINCRSSDLENQAVLHKANSSGLLITKGSDKHSDSNEGYQDLSFYEMPSSQIRQLLYYAKQSIQ